MGIVFKCTSIFKGRDELEKHKWSVRESLSKRQSRARSRGNMDPHLEDPLWTLLDTIFRSIKSKLCIAAGNKTGENKFNSCHCTDLPLMYNCIHCDRAVCDRCCRCVILQTLLVAMKIIKLNIYFQVCA